jgi:hypothetical protein
LHILVRLVEVVVVEAAAAAVIEEAEVTVEEEVVVDGELLRHPLLVHQIHTLMVAELQDGELLVVHPILMPIVGRPLGLLVPILQIHILMVTKRRLGMLVQGLLTPMPTLVVVAVAVGATTVEERPDGMPLPEHPIHIIVEVELGVGAEVEVEAAGEPPRGQHLHGIPHRKHPLRLEVVEVDGEVIAITMDGGHPLNPAGARRMDPARPRMVKAVGEVPIMKVLHVRLGIMTTILALVVGYVALIISFSISDQHLIFLLYYRERAHLRRQRSHQLHTKPLQPPTFLRRLQHLSLLSPLPLQSFPRRLQRRTRCLTRKRLRIILQPHLLYPRLLLVDMEPQLQRPWHRLLVYLKIMLGRSEKLPSVRVSFFFFLDFFLHCSHSSVSGSGCDADDL